jgi:D-alanyl-D-alanine dipeptidase
MTELEACEVLKDVVRGSCEVVEALVQFGPNSAIPHASAGTRTLQRGEMVLLDICVAVDGYYTDITRMTCFGDASRDMKEIYRIVYEAQQAAIAAIRPGVPCQEIDRAARRVITRAGYGDYFLHRTGHGLGMDIHETPYLVEGNDKPLVAGNVVTVEPGIYLPDRFGVRIEDDVLVTESGAEVLTDGQPALIETP